MAFPQTNTVSTFYVGCILVAVLYIWTAFLSPRARRLAKLPPGPKPKPLVGNLLDFPPIDDKGEVFWTAQRQQYGPISSLRLPGQVLIILNDLTYCSELLDKRATKYSGRPRMVQGGEIMGLDEGMFMIQPGDKFRSYRKISHSQLGSFTAIDRWKGQLELEARRYLLNLLESPGDFVRHIQHSAAAFILKVVYGYTTEPDGDHLEKIIVS